MARWLIAGCGDVGTALGLQLAGADDQVFGLRRSPGGLPAPLRPVAADLTDAAGLHDALEGLPDLDGVVVAVTADERTAAAYRATYLRGVQTLREVLVDLDRDPRLVFTSSTAVYGVTDGSWVDEDTPVDPTSETGAVLAEAERVVLDGPFEAVTVRLAGIYGPGRSRLLDRITAGRVTLHDPSRYTNRIHRDDCAGVLAHVLRLSEPAPVYLGVDHDPAPRAEVVRWLAEQLDAPEPPVEAGPGPRGLNKRCRNDRIVDAGYVFAHPTFRDGYAALLAGR